MQLKTILIGGASVGAILLAGAADAKTVKHNAAGPSAAEVQLQSQVKSLESRLDAQANAQQQSQAQIQAAQSQAQAAEAKAQAAQQQVDAQIETIPTQVDKATKAAAPKPSWADSTTFGSTVFANTSYVNSRSNGYQTPLTGVDYDIKRFYLQVDHKFSNVWSTEGVTDFTYDSVTGATQLYIKKAYLQAHLSDAFNFRAGAADLPWIPFVEKLYGYRFVEKEILDRTNFGTTSDWGLHAYGSFDHNIFSYAVSIVDGGGYKRAPTGQEFLNPTNSSALPCCQTANVDVEARVSATYDGFTAAVGGYNGYLGKAVVNYPYFHSAQRFDALAGYGNKTFGFYGEYFWANDWNDELQSNALKTNTSQGYSLFGNWNFYPRLAVFARFDWEQPQETTASRFTENYYNAGISYNAFKGIDFALVYKHDSVYNGLLNTANGQIGTNYPGVPLNPNILYGTYNEVGIFSRVVF